MFELVLFDNGLEEAVTAMVRSGFYSANEIVEFFREIATDDPDAGLDPDTVDEDVHRIVVAATSLLLEASANWPEKTDNDRLAEAFQHLNECGIRAVQNYGFEASDCLELYREIRGDAEWRGYCFYHNQDLARAVLGGGLAVRFSAAVDRPTDDENRAIGAAIVDILRTHGLQPEWDGDPRRVISLPFEWQRRPGKSGFHPHSAE
ncbi:MAG: hypothetical protein GXX96_17330 [Planctomycetaceae bacterium]|nr:hypothetical protein [Planctomycetaceae bacterium]